MADDKISKEEKYNEDKLKANYEQTGHCPKCHIKLPIDIKSGCNSLICN